jgi:hypothetical protein
MFKRRELVPTIHKENIRNEISATYEKTYIEIETDTYQPRNCVICPSFISIESK